MHERLGSGQHNWGYFMISRVFLSIKLLVAGFSILALGACDPQLGGTGGPRVNANKAVTVALLVPTGSSDAGVSALAGSLVKAAQLAVKEKSTTPITLKIYSTAGNPEQAATAARQAVKDGAKVILGPLFSSSANAVSLAVANTNVTVLSFSNNTDIAGGRLFVLGNSFRNTADRLVGYAAARGLTRIAAVAPRNSAGNSATTEISRAAAKYSAQYTGASNYDFTLDSVVKAAPAISRDVKSAGANVVILTADSAGALPLLAQMLPENGLNPATVKFMGLARWDIPPENLAQRGLQGGWFAVPDFSASDAFKTRYVASYGSDPHPLAGLAYDGIATVAKLLGTGSSPELSGPAIVAAGSVSGASGSFRYLSDGTVQRGLAVAEVANGTYRIIDPAPRTFGDAAF